MNNQVEESFKIISQMLLEKKGLKTINSNSHKGGFGQVLFVEDIQTKKKFAVKAQSIINQHTGQVDDNKLFFCKQESSILESVKHKNVVEYHSEYVIGFYHFLQMNLCEQSLDDWIQTRGNQMIPQAMFFHFLHQILDGIEHLHSQNYVLRDLSTKNILITTDGVIKLCDFGLAQQIDKQSILTSQIQSYNPKGVFIYFPPELIQQIEKNNQKFTQSKSGDIWAFGICLSLLGGISFIQASQFNQEGSVIKDAPLLDSFCNSIIKFILNANPKERPTISQVRKYVYDHLNSLQQIAQQQNLDGFKQISLVKSQQEFEEYYNQRDLSIPVTEFKEIEKECLKNQNKIESLLKLSQINLHYHFNFEKAQQYVELSLEKDPEDPDVYLNLADIYIIKFNYEKIECQKQIEEYIEKAHKICPNYWRIYLIKSKYLYFQLEDEKAYELSQKGLQLKSDEPELLIRQYIYQIQLGEDMFNKKLLKEAESTQVKYKFYLYYFLLGYLSDDALEQQISISYYQMQNELAPSPFAYNNMGLYYGQIENDKITAKKYFQKALEIFPNFLHAKNNLKEC